MVQAKGGSSDGGMSIQAIAFASAIGTTIEWYDFFLFGVVTPLVLNKLFFPNFDPLVGTLLAYTTFFVGFISRPIGGVIFGHYGDRIGRKTVLIMTVLIMGVATFLIGFLPTYASIGIWAPILLLVLRIFQGIGIGGEWGGAVLLAVEHSPRGKRGFYGSWPQIGVPAGLLLSAGVVYALSYLGDAEFLAWGWRIAFLVSAVLVAVGLYIRLRIMETPAFSRLQETQKSRAGAGGRTVPHPRQEHIARSRRPLYRGRDLQHLRRLYRRLPDRHAAGVAADGARRRHDFLGDHDRHAADLRQSVRQDRAAAHVRHCRHADRH